MHYGYNGLWDEQEAFDTYEKLKKNPDKRSALINALSINLSVQQGNKVCIDDAFRYFIALSCMDQLFFNFREA